MTLTQRKKLAKAARDPEAEYAKLSDRVKQIALLHGEADNATGKRGWVCQCSACRLVRIALYDGAGNAVKP